MKTSDTSKLVNDERENEKRALILCKHSTHRYLILWICILHIKHTSETHPLMDYCKMYLTKFIFMFLLKTLLRVLN